MPSGSGCKGGGEAVLGGSGGGDGLCDSALVTHRGSSGEEAGAASASAAGATEEDEEGEADRLLRDAEAAFGEIFSVKAPRDVFSGLWSGVKCVLSGVFLGLAGVFTQPIEGMREGGAAGCVRGLALGLCTGLFFSVAGFCTGLFQAVRGALVTPRAICMAGRGFRWDSEARQWCRPIPYSLPDEAAKVLNGRNEDDDDDEDVYEASPSSASRRGRVADTYYYDCLGVRPSASTQDVRRAYFQQSRRWHPDKAPEKDAKERFQTISEAYQVLSDTKRRRAYDAQGKQGAGESFVDAHAFFSVLFGADVLEPFIGRLWIAELFTEVGGLGAFGSCDGGGQEGGGQELVDDLQAQIEEMERSEARQVRRQVRLAVKLTARLDPYVRGVEGASTFVETTRAEARGILARDASLARFLEEIGWVYKNRAEWNLARGRSPLGFLGLEAILVRTRRGGREAAQKAKTARLALRSYMKLRSIAKEADDEAAATSSMAAEHHEEEDEMPSSLSSALPTFMETFWSLTAHDITGTLDKVVERVLRDSTVSLAERTRRAEGLRLLGAALAAEAEVTCAELRPAAGGGLSWRGGGGGGSDCVDDKDQQRRRFEEAFIASTGVGSSEPR